MSVRLIFNSVWRNLGNYGHRFSRLRRAATWQLEKLDETIDGILAEAGYPIFQLDDIGRPDFNRATAQNLFADPIEDTAKLR